MSRVVGIGIDLTQHIPLVTAALCPEPVSRGSTTGASALLRYWPPRVEVRGAFKSRVPSTVLPLMPGERIMVGEEAAKHRRSAGLKWPAEAQAPFAGDPACGVGRIPLVAAWTALLPRPGEKETMTRRDDPEFKWVPDGREHAARAGQMLAASIKAFVDAAALPVNSCLTAIVVPDALDEAAQQILLDSLAHVGVATDNVHLLPRPLAVAVHWCQAVDEFQATQVANDEEGTPVGRLRVATMSLDVWEAVSLEFRAYRRDGRVWLMPLRDRARLADALPELQTLRLSLALALARADAKGESLSWWQRLFASDWLARRLAANRNLEPQEVQALRDVCSMTPPEGLRRELAQLASLQPLWSRLFQDGPLRPDAICQRWESQERQLGTASLPCAAILADGAFAGLPGGGGEPLGQIFAGQTMVSPAHVGAIGKSNAAAGAALAAAAIAHGLPCYRETLLPLDLYVLGKDENDDPAPQWKVLVAAARSVEAGRFWRSPVPVTGLEIREGQANLLLPLRRALGDQLMFRRVHTELATPAKRDEPVSVQVEVKPGQGFARVRIESLTPGVFASRIDWRTMEQCAEPERPKLAYLPGVSRILPNLEMFRRAEDTMRAALDALQGRRPGTIACLRELVGFLNKYPLVHYVDRGAKKDFMLHYGVIGSDGQLDALPAPGLARALRTEIGRRFRELPSGGLERDLLLRAAGWFYLAMPQECYSHLRNRIRKKGYLTPDLSAVELHAIGLAFNDEHDLAKFYPLVLRALSNPLAPPNNWLRSIRNICRFRNHALKPDVIGDQLLVELVERLFETMAEQQANNNYARIFCNCLETVPFLLKRRRYDPDFLTPQSVLASRLLQFLERVDGKNLWRLPRKFERVPRATIKFLRMEASGTDIEDLLGVGEEGEDD
jgi:hypothetical protein